MWEADARGAWPAPGDPASLRLMARRPESAEPTWIDFPPRWPERERAPGDAERERPPVLLTTPITRLGRRERPEVPRVVAQWAPAG